MQFQPWVLSLSTYFNGMYYYTLGGFAESRPVLSMECDVELLSFEFPTSVAPHGTPLRRARMEEALGRITARDFIRAVRQRNKKKNQRCCGPPSQELDPPVICSVGFLESLPKSVVSTLISSPY